MLGYVLNSMGFAKCGAALSMWVQIREGNHIIHSVDDDCAQHHTCPIQGVGSRNGSDMDSYDQVANPQEAAINEAMHGGASM